MGESGQGGEPLQESTSSAVRPDAGSGQQGARDVLARFPIPPGAPVLVRDVDDAGLNIVLASITVQRATDFYRQALPRAGYAITRDDVAAGAGHTVSGIEFVGHGYKGSIGGAGAGPGGQSTIGISMLRQ